MTSKAPGKVIGVRSPTITYTERSAVRAIVHNSRGHVIIISATKDDYYKLPGGGIEGDEKHNPAVEREVMEETGCHVDVEDECIAVVEEWRNDLHQFSYCYVAKLIKDTGKVELTEEELEDGLKHEWATVDDALEKMKTAKPTSEFGKFIQERDVFLLESFRKP